ncbi:MAG: Tol-Pal system beta propeller repeat protein TolB [Cellvibrionaceae bacterium]
MIRFSQISIAILLLISSLSLRAELVIPIIEGVDNPTVIAVSPFGYTGVVPLSEKVSDIVSADLYRSGQFQAIAARDMLSFPSRPDEVVFRDWRLLGSEYLVIGNIQAVAGGFSATFSLYDVVSQKTVLSNLAVTVPSNGLRDMAHHISDKVYEAITGIRGAFSTKIVYIEQTSQRQYRLVRSDMDGARPLVLLRSQEPLLSPSWSPDGKRLAYVSFETSRPAIFMQEIATGKRTQLTNFQGLNGAPSWSPDGKKLALVLSKDGNPEIYTLDIASKRFTRVTNHFGIDTEPAWSNDGKAVMFTSNRGGKPQIYQITLSSGRIERLTFDGDYNAKPQVTPDGKGVVMVHRYNGVFHIAVQDIASGNIRVLTQTALDESPSIAPNGATLLYATKDGNRGILAGVSLDAGVKYKLPAKSGDVREPAWSPFLTAP